MALNIPLNFGAPTHHDAPILKEHGVQAEYARNGFCPYHPDIQLHEKKGWKTLRVSCPKCDRMNTKKTLTMDDTLEEDVTRLKMKKTETGLEKTVNMTTLTKEREIVRELEIFPRNIWIKDVKRLKANDPSLTRLYLGGNSIGNDGAKAIAEALKDNTVLTRLNLNSNSIGDDGAKAIAEALKVNTVLTELNLWSNSIDSNLLNDIQELIDANQNRKQNPSSPTNPTPSDSNPTESISIDESLNNAGTELQNLPSNLNNNVPTDEAGGPTASSISTPIDAIILRMQKNEWNGVIQEENLVKLAKWALDEYNKVTITEAVVVNEILTAMNNHSSNAKVQQCGCKALMNLAANNDENRKMICEAGGIDVILSAMKTHSTNDDVKKYGRQATQNLAENDNNKMISMIFSTESDHAKQVEHIRNGYCPYHSDIQLFKKNWFGVWKTKQDKCPSCKFLYEKRPTSFISHSNATSISSPIAAVFSKMEENWWNADYQVEGLFELQNLAVNENNKKMIAEAGGIGMILAAMKTHSSNAKVQEYGCGALWNLALNEINRMTIAEAGVIPRILLAMKYHSSKANVQHYGCGALWDLALNDDNRMTIAKEGGITTILAAMKTHSFTAIVRHYGCAALKNLAVNDNNKKTIAEEGGIATILDVMKTHSSNAKVQEYGCGALWNLALKENHRMIIEEAGGIPMILSAMKYHSSNAMCKSMVV